MCNAGSTPNGVYTTTGTQFAMRVFKRNYLADQIELIFTAYHEGMNSRQQPQGFLSAED
jgi:hypothetical protein